MMMIAKRGREWGTQRSCVQQRHCRRAAGAAFFHKTQLRLSPAAALKAII
jgi:hypothetical protein